MKESPGHIMKIDELCLAVLSGGMRFALVVSDCAGRMVSCNRAAASVFGLHDGLAGTDLACIFTSRQQQAGLPRSEMHRAMNQGSALETRLYRHLATGAECWIESDLSALFDQSGAHIGYLRVAHDVHERHLTEEITRGHADTDPLTGLLNRRAFYEKLDQATAGSLRKPNGVILHLIDLDQFKPVNDSLGHAAGDIVLREIASRLKSVIRESDHVGRLGGDEFAVLQTGAATTLDGSHLARKLGAACRQPIHVANHEVTLSASIGIATVPADGHVPGELLRKADLALYRVKSEGRDTYCYFTEAFDTQAKRHDELVSALRDAVADRRFHLVYQPIMDMSDDRIHRAEALLRCDHPAFKDVSVERVLELLRHSGDMPTVSAWILDQACNDARQWLSEGHAPLQVAVNLCARELADLATVDLVAGALRAHDLEPSHLSVELTEHDIFDNKACAHEVLSALRAMGVAISLDDFGTGYSSMEHLVSLPVNALKLDRSFISNLPENPVSAKVVSALIGLAHSLGLRVVAEGVEHARQRECLSEYICDELQGFLISAPLDAVAFSRFRANHGAH